MTTIEKNRISAIVKAIANGNAHLFDEIAYDEITDAIFWAWENWSTGIVSLFYTGDKPERPTYEFRKQWLENELGNFPENWATLIHSFAAE